MDTFSTRLKSLRKEKNLTQKQIAAMLNISLTGYAGWEQGYREPNIESIKKLCDILETSADYLLGITDN